MMTSEDDAHPIELQLDYQRLNTFFADYLKNISRGGTFINTKKPLPVGTQKDLHQDVDRDVVRRRPRRPHQDQPEDRKKRDNPARGEAFRSLYTHAHPRRFYAEMRRRNDGSSPGRQDRRGSVWPRGAFGPARRSASAPAT